MYKVQREPNKRGDANLGLVPLVFYANHVYVIRIYAMYTCTEIAQQERRRQP
jgi:hypothetical protein